VFDHVQLEEVAGLELVDEPLDFIALGLDTVDTVARRIGADCFVFWRVGEAERLVTLQVVQVFTVERHSVHEVAVLPVEKRRAIAIGNIQFILTLIEINVICEVPGVVLGLGLGLEQKKIITFLTLSSTHKSSVPHNKVQKNITLP